MISQSMIQGVVPLIKKPRKGDTVLYYYCDGCMATDHTLRYVGKVVGFYS